MAPRHLQKRDEACNMARFYRVDVAPTLFGESSVVRTWGRIGTPGRTALETFPTLEAAEAAGAQTIRTKLRRGYAFA
ncbi:MAG: WGR domain-containing protein [Pseudorhodobacter sp.]|nr:WGR domain-containing protein [Pseudorhodobacter sp.]